MAPLTLTFFGSFEAKLADQPVTGFESDKVRALLAYLAVEQTQPHRREQLADLFWPDKSERVARGNLRHVLPNLRRAIGDYKAKPPHLLISRTTLQFNPDSDHHCDVTTCQMGFETGLAQQNIVQLEQTIALYRGPFLAGFAPNISLVFDDWLYLLREKLQRLALRTLDTLTNHYGQQADFGQALAYAQQQISLAPWHEGAHRQTMRYLALSGQRSAALAHFETCRRYLSQELGVDPGQETLRLVQQIETGALSQPDPAQWQANQQPDVARPNHNLPAQTTPFIGRQTELSQLDHLFADPTLRLITLHGPGGIGKTRLALEAVTSQIAHYADGVYFVPLASFDTVDGLISATAKAIGYTFHSDNRPSSQQLLDFLQTKEILLLFDNLEHLPQGVPFLQQILETAPQVRLLTTSRTRLMLSGETVFTLSGLAMPASATESAAQSEAVALFSNAAQRVQSDFSLTTKTGIQVAQICQAVQGMPLAILLASSWVGQLTLTEITAQVLADNEQPLDFLETEWHDFPERQRSMRAVCRHTWQLLSSAEKAVCRQLALFRGGFNREAATAITGASLKLLTRLVNKSLLQREPNGRYNIHELLRQHAQAQLEAADQVVTVQDAHARYYLHFLKQREADLKNQRQKAALADIEVESENIRVAWQWAVTHQQVDMLAEAAESLALFYEQRGHYRAGKTAFTLAVVEFETSNQVDIQTLWLRLVAYQAIFLHTLGQLEQADQVSRLGLDRLSSPALDGLDLRREKALLLYSRGYNAQLYVGFATAMVDMKKSLALWQDVEDLWYTARTLRELARLAHKAGDAEAMYMYVMEAQALWRKLGNVHGEAEVLAQLSFCRELQGNHRKAEKTMLRSMILFKEVDDLVAHNRVSGHLGILLWLQGRYEEAYGQIKEGLPYSQKWGDMPDVAIRYDCLANITLHLGHYDEAEQHARQGLALAQAQQNDWMAGSIYRTLGQIALRNGDDDTAHQHFQRSYDLSEHVGPRDLRHRAQLMLALVELRLGNQAKAKQSLRTVLQALRQNKRVVSLAYSFAIMSLLLSDQGQLERAIELYALAYSHLTVSNSCWFDDIAGKPIRAAAARLDPAIVDAAEARGQAHDFAATQEALIAELTLVTDKPSSQK